MLLNNLKRADIQVREGVWQRIRLADTDGRKYVEKFIDAAADGNELDVLKAACNAQSWYPHVS